MELNELIETISGGFIIYGLMWIIVLFLLFIQHSVEDEQIKTKNPNKTGSGSTD